MSTITAEWTEHDSRNLTVTLVAVDGHHMPLRKQERHDAIRAMLARGVPVETMAHRLHLSVAALRRDCLRAGIQLPDTHPVQDWWVAYICPSQSADRQRDWRERKRQLTEATG